MTDNTYNSFCENENSRDPKQTRNISGAQFVSTHAIIFVIVFGLTF